MISIEECISLKPYTTFGVPVVARFFAEASTIDELQSLITIFSDNPKPKLILGGGSNLLFTDDFDGVVIYPNLTDIVVVRQNEEHAWVKAEAGVNWDQFVSLCCERNWGGAENLSLIPGNVGASPVQNIGAYGVEVKDLIEQVEAIHLSSGQKRIFTNAECRFGYRDSIFKQEEKGQWVIVSVIFKLNKKPVLKTKYADVEEELKSFSEKTVQTVREAIIRIRKRKLPDPKEFGNAGSFFKNPVIPVELYNRIKVDFPDIPHYPAHEGFVKIPAAWLIQTQGWKGRRDGNVGTYPTQPLVIVNYGQATGKEVFEFARSIQHSVKEKFQVKLEMEVNIF
jgi:UDP-N-acetylmuramate dehydrogenase